MEATMKANAGVWTGRVLSALVILFMLMDASMKLAYLPIVTETTGQLGWPVDEGHIRGLAITLLFATLLYAYPRTAILGAILLTGYLGGAVATHVRIGSPLFSHVLFGVYLGIFAWGGLYLRDAKLRTLVPLRAKDA
jgi:hypothetical protein